MKPTAIALPAEVEPYVRRLAIGAGQPEYFVIPAVKLATPDGGMVAYLSRWELTPSEKNAIARSELRGMLIAFSTWMAAKCAGDPRVVAEISDTEDGDVAFAKLAHEFIRAHASQLEGEDAALWYTRMLGDGDPYQPQTMEVGTEPPIHVEEISTTPVMPASPFVQ